MKMLTLKGTSEDLARERLFIIVADDLDAAVALLEHYPAAAGFANYAVFAEVEGTFENPNCVIGYSG